MGYLRHNGDSMLCTQVSIISLRERLFAKYIDAIYTISINSYSHLMR